jgi:hypothetical protein
MYRIADTFLSLHRHLGLRCKLAASAPKLIRGSALLQEITTVVHRLTSLTQPFAPSER